MTDNLICEIAQLGANVLRQKAEPVADIFSTETQDIIQKMQATLQASEGVGLSAPQIGISKRIIIVASRPTQRYPTAPLMQPTVMFNPSFYTLNDAKVKGWEGCLSIPGIRALVPRYQRIQASYTAIDGTVVSLEASDFVARIIQHEFDHLEGRVYLDSVENNQDIIAENEYFKL